MKPWMLYVAAALLAFGWWRHHEADLRAQGAAAERERALLERNAALEDEAGRIDTVYRTDTITLRKVRYRTDSLLITDTVIRADTVRQIVEQERRACDAVVSTCEAAKANLRAQLAVSDSLRRIAEKRQPGFIRRTFGCTVGIDARIRPNAVCGVRFP